MNHYWMEDAERVHDGPYIGECDNGDLWVERGGRWERFNARRQSHLRAYWRSRRAGRVVWLERAS